MNPRCHRAHRIQRCENKHSLSCYRGYLILMLMLLGAWIPTAQSADESSELVSRWIQTQTNLQTWSAKVVQTRQLKTLTEPLVAEGHVWFTAPNLFRWEIGQPASTVAIRQPHQMLIIYPRLKRAERFHLDASIQGPWRDILVLIDAGFPRSKDEMDDRFRILDQKVAGQTCTLEMEPAAATARQIMPGLRVSFSTENFSLQSTELTFADGSTLRNEFHETALNPTIDPGLFQPKLPDDFKVVEPSLR